MLLTHPGSYYHYEPLLDFGIKQIRDGVEATNATSNLKKLFHCNYTGLGMYLNLLLYIKADLCIKS